MIAWLRRAWTWLAVGALLVGAAAVALWRRAVGQRDEARAQRDAAAAAQRRTEDVRAAELRARREADAARAEIAERARQLDRQRADVERRRDEARAEVDDARDDAALARILDERRKAGRLP